MSKPEICKSCGEKLFPEDTTDIHKECMEFDSIEKETCPICDGNGCLDDSTTCSQCDGDGMIEC